MQVRVKLYVSSEEPFPVQLKYITWAELPTRREMWCWGNIRPHRSRTFQSLSPQMPTGLQTAQCLKPGESFRYSGPRVVTRISKPSWTTRGTTERTRNLFLSNRRSLVQFSLFHVWSHTFHIACVSCFVKPSFHTNSGWYISIQLPRNIEWSVFRTILPP